MNEPITTTDPRYNPKGVATPWEETCRVLETAELFWISTVRADGRPHVTPCVPVWHDGAIHFTTAATAQKTVNLRANPHVVLTTGCNHTEGLTVVVEGDAVRITAQDALLPRSRGVGVQVGWKLAIPGTQRVFLPLRCRRTPSAHREEPRVLRHTHQGLRLRHRPHPNPLPVLTARVASLCSGIGRVLSTPMERGGGENLHTMAHP